MTMLLFLAHWCPHCQKEVPIVVDEHTCEGLGMCEAMAVDYFEVQPTGLVRILDEHPGWTVREGDRMTCLQILPAGENATGRLQRQRFRLPLRIGVGIVAQLDRAGSG